MSAEELEKRLQILEDLEDIKKLKAKYAQLVDDNFNPEVAKLFTKNAESINIRGERCEGRDKIRRYQVDAQKRITFTQHFFTTPYIEVEGNKAQGLWYMWNPLTLADGQQLLRAGVEKEKYEKINGQWLIASCHVILYWEGPQSGTRVMRKRE